MSVRDCIKDTNLPHCKDAALHLWFSGDLRFTYIDPFMEWDKKEWVGVKKQKNFNMNSTKNHRQEVMIVGVGTFENMGLASD